MIKGIVTNEKLNWALMDLINGSEFYYWMAKSYFKDMYITGCRSDELLFKERWIIEEDLLTLTTFKTKAKRSFFVGDLSEEFTEAIRYDVQPYGGLTSYQLMAEYKRHFKLSNLHCGEKATQLYAFRYNRARIEYERLQDVSQVMEYMGWTNPNVALGYITNTLREVK